LKGLGIEKDDKGKADKERWFCFFHK